VGLANTGDGADVVFTVQSIKSMLNRMGITLEGPISDFVTAVQGGKLDVKNAAAVMVTAELPGFAKPGQRIDVNVSAMGKAASLRGGNLILTSLRGVDGEVYALAQGQVNTTGIDANAAGSKVAIGVPTSSRIPNGATVERMVDAPFDKPEFIVLNPFLVKDLKKAGLWNQQMVDQLKYFDGELGPVEGMPEELKKRYLTAFAVGFEWIMAAAARRQKWIDQSQSLNLFLGQPDLKALSRMYRLAMRCSREPMGSGKACASMVPGTRPSRTRAMCKSRMSRLTKYSYPSGCGAALATGVISNNMNCSSHHTWPVR